MSKSTCKIGRRLLYVIVLSLVLTTQATAADELYLQELIDEALQNSPEILGTMSRSAAAKHRVPQVSSLPDPMLMTGYQNEGLTNYSYGDSTDAQWMFGVSQMFPLGGKLGLKGEMASAEAGSLAAEADNTKLKVVERVKSQYYDLFLAYKTLDILGERNALFSRIEEAAIARYSSGMGPQQEVLMAQVEKYMILERQRMQQQRVQSAEAMLNNVVGRDATSPLGRPVEPAVRPFTYQLNEMIEMAAQHSPEIKAKEKMVKAAEAKLSMARREYVPDITLNGTYFSRNSREFPDMWSATATFNIPLYFRTKQDEGVREGLQSLSQAKHELRATQLMISSALRDSYSMIKTAEQLMDLYQKALIPKNYQDYELALSGYVSGKIEAITVISTLKALLDSELLYWVQVTEREKAIARHESLIGAVKNGS